MVANPQCAVCGQTHETMHYHANCHIKSPLQIEQHEGQILIRCAECHKAVCRLRVITPELGQACYQIMSQILETWDPPLRDDPENRCVATCVQTASMGCFAYLLGDLFPYEALSDTQRKAVEEFVAELSKEEKKT